MSRITNAILDQKAFARGANQPMLDITYGGQMGYAPNLAEWVSNQAYVRKNIIPILLEAPRGFQRLPDPQKWVDSLKSLIELHCRTIEGLNAELTVEVDSHPVGGAGEIQEEIIDSKRARSEITMGFVEKYGNPIQTFLDKWIRFLMMDPDTKFALANTLDGQQPQDALADQYTCSVLFIEPDPNHRRVVKSWLSTNMMPLGTGEIIGKRDLTTASELTNLSIRWTSITQFNLGTNVFAQSILDQINMINANPNLRPAILNSVSPDVLASAEGYKKNIEDLGKSALKV